MLPLENQVCTREQAKRIDELGVKAESLWVWVYFWYYKKWILRLRHHLTSYVFGQNNYPAYTGSEFDLLLPEEVCRPPTDVYIYRELHYTAFKAGGEFICGYSEDDWDWSNDMPIQAHNKIPAHAKADLLIQLLEEKIIKPEEIKL